VAAVTFTPMARATIIMIIVIIVIAIVITFPATTDQLQIASSQLCGLLGNFQGVNGINVHMTVPFFQV
jgi:hypothetical protein